MKIIINNSDLIFRNIKPYFETIATEKVSVTGEETRSFIGALNGKKGWVRVRPTDFESSFVENEANRAYFRVQTAFNNSNLIGLSRIFMAIPDGGAEDTRVNIFVSKQGYYSIDYLENIDDIPLSVVMNQYANASELQSGIKLGTGYNLSNPISKNRKLIVKDNSYLKCYNASASLQNTIALEPNVEIDLSTVDYEDYEFFRIQSINDNPIVSIENNIKSKRTLGR